MIDQAVERVWQEQRRQWLRGNRVPAEDYLCALGPQCSAEERFDIIYGEIMLRREIGPPPTLAEYQNRFPEFAARLARQWCFDSVADGLDEVERDCPDVSLRFAGVKARGDRLVTAGGRVLTVVATAPSYEIAIARAYEAASKIRFDGMQYRRDIGKKALRP